MFQAFLRPYFTINHIYFTVKYNVNSLSKNKSTIVSSHEIRKHPTIIFQIQSISLCFELI